jgi:lysophospholipase
MHTFEEDALTHDRERYAVWHEQLFACPHLAVGSPTWGWLQFALKLGEGLLLDKAKVLKKLKLPISIVCSGDDHVINKQPSKTFAKKLGKGQYLEIAGAEHEVLIEIDDYRRQAMAEFDELADFAAPRGISHHMHVQDNHAGVGMGLMAADIAEVASELPEGISPESLITEEEILPDVPDPEGQKSA